MDCNLPHHAEHQVVQAALDDALMCPEQAAREKPLYNSIPDGKEYKRFSASRMHREQDSRSEPRIGSRAKTTKEAQ